MYPKPRTSTHPIRTLRHPFRDLKVREPRPYARLVDTEHREILRDNLARVTLVRNSKRATFEIIETRSMEFGYRLVWADIVTLTDISARRRCEE